MSILQKITAIELNDAPLAITICVSYAIYRYMLTHLMFLPIAKLLKVKRVDKFAHRAFDLSHYTISAIFGLIVVARRQFGSCMFYGTDCPQILMPNPDSFEVTVFEKLYIFIFLSYYVVDCFYMHTQSDLITMSCHHFFTTLLIVCSIVGRCTSQCLLIMVLHDIVDIPLYTGKIFSYLRKQSLANAALITFATLCIYFRNIIYPIIVYNSIKNGIINDFYLPNLYTFMMVLLCGLLGCHLFWTYKIFCVISESITGRNKIRDSRSD